MDEPIIHLAGNAVTVGGRVIQRCAICGEKLCDSVRAAVAAAAGEAAEFSVYKVGSWVKAVPRPGTEALLLRVGGTESPALGGEIPEGCCLELVEP